jgi:hypothetical protein
MYWATYKDQRQSLQLLILAGASLTQQLLNELPKDGSVMRNPALVEWLQYQASNVKSLQCLARLTIRQKLIMVTRGKSIMQLLYKLPLPAKLQRFLSLEDEVLLKFDSDEDIQALDQ